MPRPASKYDALYEKYSFLSEVFMFECGDGWFDLLSELCAKLAALKLGPDFKIVQVKEKFGKLRVYVNAVPQEKKKEVDQLIARAESESSVICEHCGKPGKTTHLNQGCYIITLCSECGALYNKPG